jgi:hypothetical protein
MNRLFIFAGLVLLAGGAVRGEPPPGVKAVRVELRPAVPPSPVLRFPLLPPLGDQKSGNAAPLYDTASMHVKDTQNKLNDLRYFERLERWRNLPLERFPRESARAFFLPLEAALAEVADAARHEYADWELNDKARKFGINLMLPHLQQTRALASLLTMHARLALADGRTEDAVRDLQTTLAMAQHVGRGPTMICPLVGMAIAQLAAGEIDLLIQQPGAANFYWALSDLPQPVIDLRPAFQGERLLVYGTFPYVPQSPNAPETHVLTTDEIKKALQLILDAQEGNLFAPAPVYKTYLALDIQQKHERAKRELVEVGWPSAKLDQMPHIEVALLHGLLEYDRNLDEAAKWLNLPYWQAEPMLAGLGKKYQTVRGLTRPDAASIPLAALISSAYGRIYFARARTERKFAALRCLEAIRLYAARHDGKLPLRLDQIKEVPVPVDPFTGKPFEYEATGDRATLYSAARAAPVQGQKANPQLALLYEITLKR